MEPEKYREKVVFPPKTEFESSRWKFGRSDAWNWKWEFLKKHLSKSKKWRSFWEQNLNCLIENLDEASELLSEDENF